jgi:hypothetical protein
MFRARNLFFILNAGLSRTSTYFQASRSNAFRNQPNGVVTFAASRRARACLDIFMNRDPRWALSQELEAKQPLHDQLLALATEDPDFLIDLIEGETNHRGSRRLDPR